MTVLEDYHAALKAGDNETAEFLRDKWIEEVEASLEQMGDAVMEAKQQVNTNAFKRGERRKLYERLKADYRKAVALSKELSAIKKQMREDGAEERLERVLSQDEEVTD